MKIGHVVIATNRYMGFAKPLLDSAKEHFLTNHDVTMFLFTNVKAIEGVVRVEQKHEPWPGMTLKRYQIFWKNRDIFKDMDYIYYTDVDMLFVDKVGDEILGELTATYHPGFFNAPTHLLPYEKNPRSTAYVNPSERKSYYAGGFNGGKRDTFLSMSETILNNIESDMEWGYTAEWHDESHLNRFLIDNPPEVSLDPSYCFPKDAIWAQNSVFKKTMKLCPLEKDHSEYQI